MKSELCYLKSDHICVHVQHSDLINSQQTILKRLQTLELSKQFLLSLKSIHLLIEKKKRKIKEDYFKLFFSIIILKGE